MTMSPRRGVLDELKEANQAFAALVTQMRTLQDLRKPEKETESSVVSFMECRYGILALLECISTRLLCEPQRQCAHALGLPCFPMERLRQSSTPRWTFSHICFHSRTANSLNVSSLVARPCFSTSRTPSAILTELCGLHDHSTYSQQDESPDRQCRVGTPENEGQMCQDDDGTCRDPYGASGVGASLQASHPIVQSQHQIRPKRLRPDFNPLVGWAVDRAEGPYWLLEEIKFRPQPPIVSLREILGSNGKYSCFPRYFFEGDRSRLAASLSSAVLFYSTRGWLVPDWTSSDILLNAENRDVEPSSLRNPFMLFSLAKSAISERTLASQQGALAAQQFGVRNRWLYALGTVLLEILLNSPLESYRERREESRAEIAWRIEKLAMQHGGPRWAEIIFRCMHCPFSEQPDLSTTAFFDRVYTDVVQPLLAFTNLPSVSDYRAPPPEAMSY